MVSQGGWLQKTSLREQENENQSRGKKPDIKPLYLEPDVWWTADYADEFYENLRDKDNPATKDLILSQHFRMPENNIKHINSNMIVIGAPGSGKTQCIVKPNLLQMDGNYVVLDYGGELMCDTKKQFLDAGCRVIALDLGYDWPSAVATEMESNVMLCQCDPLLHLDTEESIDMMVECVIANSEPYVVGPPCVIKSEESLKMLSFEKNMLKAKILYTLDHLKGVYKGEYYGLYAFIEHVSVCGRSRDSSCLPEFEKRLEKIAAENPNDRYVLTYRPLLELPMEYRLKIATSLWERLCPFATHVPMPNHECEINFSDLEKEKTILYVMIPYQAYNMKWYMSFLTT